MVLESIRYGAASNKTKADVMGSRFPSPHCPFYGFRWPERSDTLVLIGNNECGLDFEAHAPCRMETSGRHVNVHVCPVALPMKTMLDAAGRHIHFRVSNTECRTLAEWYGTARSPLS